MRALTGHVSSHSAYRIHTMCAPLASLKVTGTQYSRKISANTLITAGGGLGFRVELSECVLLTACSVANYRMKVLDMLHALVVCTAGVQAYEVHACTCMHTRAAAELLRLLQSRGAI